MIDNETVYKYPDGYKPPFAKVWQQNPWRIYGKILRRYRLV